MRASNSVLRVLLLVLAVCLAACADRPASEQSPEVGPTSESEVPQASEVIEEETTVAYDSETHGAVEVHSVSDNPADYFDVLRDGERALVGNPRRLDESVELPPGTYLVDVNRTQRSVTVEAGRKTILWTGDLVVRGEPATAYWYPLQGEERKLSNAPPLLNRARALFPGTYTVFVHTGGTDPDHNLGAAEVKAGQTTALDS